MGKYWQHSVESEDIALTFSVKQTRYPIKFDFQTAIIYIYVGSQEHIIWLTSYSIFFLHVQMTTILN